jgi:hypothetical protein
MHRPAANRTGHFAPRISLGIRRQMLFQQTTSQAVAQIACPLLTLAERDQPVLPIAPKHLIERLAGLFLELLPALPQFFTGKSRHVILRDRWLLKLARIHPRRKIIPRQAARSNGRAPARVTAKTDLWLK